MKAAIYARVSTRGQKEEGTSLETQVEAMETWGEEHGYTDTHVFQENYSGTQLNRPQLDKVKELARLGKMDALLVHSWDRLGRDMEHQIILRYFFEEQWGVNVVCITQPEMGELEGLIYRTVMGLGAEISNYLRREATIRGKRAKVLAGEVMGSNPAPFGYEYTHDERRGKQVRVALKVNEKEAKTVRQIYEWFVEDGLSISAITKRLTQACTPTAADLRGTIRKKAEFGVWNRASVRRILTNPVYDGRWYYNEIEVKVPTIVSHEVWLAAQARIRDNKDRYGTTSKYEYLLSGRLWCGTCGKARIGTSTKAGGKVYRYYVCPDLSKGCRSKRIRANEAENFVLLFVLHLLTDPDVLWQWLKRLKEGIEDGNKPLREELDALSMREQDLEGKRERCRMLFLEKEITKGRFDQEIRKIKEEKVRIGDRQEYLKQGLEQPISEERIFALTRHFRRLADELGIDEWADVRPPDGYGSMAFSCYIEQDKRALSDFHNNPLARKLDGLTFEEKRRLIESMRIGITTDEEGIYRAFAFTPVEAFRIVDKSSTPSSSQNT